MTKYPIAERFFAPQGEGLFTGTPFAFIRFVGCSVGQKVCTACDTNFDQMYPHLGGGLYTIEELIDWAGDYKHVCFTGGEPLDRDLRDACAAFAEAGCRIHFETSGTKHPDWLRRHVVTPTSFDWVTELIPWVSVSPKPGYLASMIERADEIKVILGGLGDGPGWPTVNDAVQWAKGGKLIYLQPRNGILDIDRQAMNEVLAILEQRPMLRLSAQLHKYLRTR